MKHKSILTLIIIFILTTNLFSTQIDIMVLYTTEANNNLTNYGELKNAYEEALEAIEYTNQAYINSNINIILNLVHHQEIEFTPSGNDGESLYWLMNPSDGIIDTIHDLRDQYHADIVVLISSGGSVAGIGGYSQGNSTRWDSEAFCIINVGNDMTEQDNRTFAHEIGHILGAQHDWYSGPLLGLYNGDMANHDIKYENKGYIYVDTINMNAFATIMSYASMAIDMGIDPDSIHYIQYFSNPTVNYNGIPTGKSEIIPYWDINYECYSASTTINYCDCPADNAGILNWMASTIANYRDSLGPDDRVKNLSVSQPDWDIIKLEWTENITNEDGFRIFRSIDNGMNFNLIDSISENSTEYYDTINTPISNNDKWIYRVQAINTYGASTYDQDDIEIGFTCAELQEDFETGDLSNLGWQNDENFPWFVSSRADGKGYALRGDTNLTFMGWNIGDPTPAISYTGQFEDGYICFEYNVANTMIEVKIDDEMIPIISVSISGDWDTIAFPISAGLRKVSWEFWGDGYGWIDNIHMPLYQEIIDTIPPIII